MPSFLLLLQPSSFSFPLLSLILFSLSCPRALLPHRSFCPSLYCCLKKAVLPLLLLSLANLFPAALPHSLSPLRFSLAFPLSPEFLIVWKGHLSPGFFILRFHPSAVHEHTKRLSYPLFTTLSSPFLQLPSSSLLPFGRLLLRILVTPFSFLETLPGSFVG